jgi:hypothetical protein
VSPTIAVRLRIAARRGSAAGFVKPERRRGQRLAQRSVSVMELALSMSLRIRGVGNPVLERLGCPTGFQYELSVDTWSGEGAINRLGVPCDPASAAIASMLVWEFER